MTTNEMKIADGTHIRLRTIEPADAPLLIEIFDHMGVESRFLRFHETAREPDPARVQAEARAIAEMPPSQGIGWVALARLPGGRTIPIGAVRYVYSADRRSAEFALSVRDDYQRRGIGTWFVEHAIEQARAEGLTHIFGYVQHENEGMWRILRRLTVEVETRFEEGEPVVTLYVQQRREPISSAVD